MNPQDNESCTVAFLMTLAADGININALSAEQLSAMNRLFRAGFQAGGEYVLKQAKQTIDELAASKAATL